MPAEKRGWRNPPKEVEHADPGHCKLCHKDVKNLKAHMKEKHKGEKNA